MGHDKIGPREIAQRDLAAAKRSRLNKTSRKVGTIKAQRPLIPFAGKDNLVRGGKNSPATRGPKGGKP